MRGLLVVAVVGSAAHADPLDEIGFGAAATGMAGSRAATAIGAEAAHVNPASIARATRPELLLGWQYSYERLELDGHDASVPDAHGITLGLAVPIRVADRQLATGLALYLPDTGVARLRLVPATQPQFVRLSSTAQRVVVEPVVALSLGTFAVGAGASLLTDVQAKHLAFDVGGDQQGRASVDAALPYRAAPLASLWWRPRRDLELAATYRGQLSLDLALDLRTSVDVPAITTGEAMTTLRSVAYFTPMRAALAAAFHPHEDLVVTADLAWERWRGLGSAVPDIHILVALDRMPPEASTVQPPAHFKNIVTPRLGAEWQTGVWRLRAGAAYLPSPVPAQTGFTSFADGARTLASLGVGWRVEAGAVLTRPLDLDLGLGWEHVMHEVVHKDMAMLPDGTFSSGGNILKASLTSTVRF